MPVTYFVNGQATSDGLSNLGREDNNDPIHPRYGLASQDEHITGRISSRELNSGAFGRSISIGFLFPTPFFNAGARY
ncbi:hypothetical protein CEXT_501831 [Caerostris extrusa]|uniref:Uncharacterized protein n=1 Tax=Caerostris extrusa TaxID=172846 RepID=A0AAV4Y456_CAEEX|nr:hypothetical protein CEXT_501831 [Caerostris extrusa]